MEKNNQKVTVIGLGYVGLPLALLIANKGFKVKGYDVSLERLQHIRTKQVKIDDSFASEVFEETDLDVDNELTSSDIYIVCVPTPVDKRNQPDLKPLMGAINSISKVLEDNQLVVIESTIYPGMCEEEIQPILEKTGKKYLLAHCPERINPGDKKWNVNNIPRVVGGICDRSSIKAAEFYKEIINSEVKQLSSIRNAEATKLLENIFRDVNTALVNEMAQSFYRMGIDIKEVIEASSTKPFAYMPHYPGVGVGGHCIAVDPYYMIEKGRLAGFDHELLRIARKINSYMPIYTVNLLQNTFNHFGMSIKGKKIGVYGLAYKPEVNDTRESPSFEIIKRLKELKGAEVVVYDPFVKNQSDVNSFDEFIGQNLDAVIICTAHKEIVNFNYEKLKDKNIKVILDGRNCLDKERIKELDIVYRGIGRE
ncbi:MAG: nucleotide sugar dehydrogenase [Nanoarchaeota archaeon]